MAAKKLTRKELLNEPDELFTTTGRVIDYVRRNPRKAFIACVTAVACLVGVSGFYTYRNHLAIQSNEIFQKTLVRYETASRASAQVSPEELDGILAAFEAISKDYPSLPAGEMALLYSGHVLYKKGELRKALERYDQAQSTGIVKGGLGLLVLYHVATTRMALKEYDPAVKLFEELSQDTNSPYRREALVSTARIYESQSKKKEAVQAYRQYLKMFPEAPDAPFVRARISDLSAEG